MFVLSLQKSWNASLSIEDQQSSTVAKMIVTPFYAGDLQINGDWGMIAAHLDCMVDTRKNFRVCQPQNLTVNTNFEI